MMNGDLIIPFVLQWNTDSSVYWPHADVGPTVIDSWGYGDYNLDSEDVKASKKSPWGCVVGSSDGGLVVFHPDFTSSLPQKVPKVIERKVPSSEGTHLPYRRPAHLSNPQSRSTSPSASRSNLNALAPSKSRAVSGVSKELAEAPKNFVDFEEEQERMKDMLGDRVVRDKGVADGLRPQMDKGVVVEKSPRPSSLKPSSVSEKFSRRSDDTRSLLSVDSSNSMTPRSILSPPLSPSLDISHSRRHSSEGRKCLQVKYRILPQKFGVGHAITDVKVLDGGELFIALQESGTVSVYNSQDGKCIVNAEPGVLLVSTTPSVTPHGTGSQMPWTWRNLYLIPQSNSLIVWAVANADTLTAALETESEDKTRITAFELSNYSQYEFGETKVTKLVDIIVSGKAEGVTVHQDPNGIIKLYQIDNSSDLIVRPIRLSAPTIQVAASETEVHSSPSSISLPQPLRNLISRSGTSTPVSVSSETSPRFDSIMETNAGSIPLTGNVGGLKLQHLGGTISGLAWSSDELLIFSLGAGKVHLRSVIPVRFVRDAFLIDKSTLRVLYAGKVETYALPDDGINESCLSVSDRPIHITTNLVTSIPLPHATVFASLNASSQMLFLRKIEDNRWAMGMYGNLSQRKESTRLWDSPSVPTHHTTNTPCVTSVLPLDLSTIFLGYSDGVIKRITFSDLICKGTSRTDYDSEDGAIGVAILSLHLVQDAMSGKAYVVGGGDDGSINFWDLKSLELQVRRITFCEPLVHTISPSGTDAGRLQGCSLCISSDGTIAVLALETFELLYIVPGSPARLVRVCIGTDNLMLLYADGRARLWDTKTREFWRSMSAEKSVELLSQGGWTSMDVGDNRAKLPQAMLSSLNRSSALGDPPPTVLLDLVQFIDNFTSSLSGKGVNIVNIGQLRAFLTAVITPGFDDQVDRLAAEFLGTSGPNIGVGAFDIYKHQQIYITKNAHGVWQISPEATASRLLVAASVLRVLMNIGGYEDPASLILSFLTTALPGHVGLNYQPPSLAFLAFHLTESPVAEIRLAARLIFESEVARLPDDDIIAIVEQWQHRLPCVLPDVEKQSTKAALALTLCGSIATEKYSLLSATTITDIAKSISLYLYDDTSPYRVLAIDLCSRGFDIWQQHFDAMEALRSLFTLATSARKESIHVRNPGPQARMAVLQIASSNSPLFMTTLSLDILHPRSIEYSKSIMQIIAFLIRKKPLVLYPNLPRMMEAVVKSLDPGSNADREAVLDSVTEIIALVVQTFPTVDFHSGSQRLAVGTSEGAVIMYDLKTATRLYVLEGHRRRLAGISFSPDGRRLVTLSIEESVLLVWKVGSSFTSFFHPGAPPRQGHSGSDPYKTFPFVLGDGTHISVEDTLEKVHFDWHSSRSVQVKIREAVFTFST